MPERKGLQRVHSFHCQMAEMKDVKFITVVSDGSTWNVTGPRSRIPTTKRLAALAVPLVMLVYQTQNRRVAVATRDSES